MTRLRDWVGARDSLARSEQNTTVDDIVLVSES